MTQYPVKEPDIAAYIRLSRSAECFVCGIIARQPQFHAEKIVFEDDDHIAFLNAYPPLLGYTLVCPKRHVTDLLRISAAAYLATQAVVHRVATAVSAVVDTERMYVMSLGSMEGNSHIHWHIAPLPPGVPYEQQQYHALMSETAGVLDIPDTDREALAARIRERLE